MRVAILAAVAAFTLLIPTVPAMPPLPGGGFDQPQTPQLPPPFEVKTGASLIARTATSTEAGLLMPTLPSVIRKLTVLVATLGAPSQPCESHTSGPGQ